MHSLLLNHLLNTNREVIDGGGGGGGWEGGGTTTVVEVCGSSDENSDVNADVILSKSNNDWRDVSVVGIGFFFSCSSTTATLICCCLCVSTALASTTDGNGIETGGRVGGGGMGNMSCCCCCCCVCNCFVLCENIVGVCASIFVFVVAVVVVPMYEDAGGRGTLDMDASGRSRSNGACVGGVSVTTATVEWIVAAVSLLFSRVLSARYIRHHRVPRAMYTSALVGS